MWVDMKQSFSRLSRSMGFVLPLLALFALNGCATLDEAFGVAKISPDESQVITHDPLKNPKIATLPQPGEGVDNTIVPEPVDLEDKIRAELEEEKRRGYMPEAVSPESLEVIKAQQAESGEEASQSASAQTKSSEPSSEKSGKKPWWKIW